MKNRPDLSKLTHEEKDTLIYALLDRLERAEERIKELERRLGMDSSNSSKPPSSDGYKKPPKPQNLREKTGKKSGGQEGHKGSNLRQVENPNNIVDHCPDSCSGCNEALGLEQSTGYQKRQVFDIPKPKPVEVTEHRAHRCLCSRCGEKTEASFPEGVTAATQYGGFIAALVVYFLHWQLIPEDRLAELMHDVFGVEISTATIATMAQRKASEWNGLAQHIGEEVKKAAVKHLDETGYRITKMLQWLHVASTVLLTFYRATPKRGAMLEGVCGIIVHDFWKSYFTMSGVVHALCNAHHMRELKALLDAGDEPWARAMSQFLRHACHAANLARQRKEPLDAGFLEWLSARYDRIIAEGVAFHEALQPLDRKRRGKRPRRKGHNLVTRLRDHKAAALLFLTNPAVPFTNNQAERDIRMMKLRQKISGCFRSQAGAEAFATTRTVLSTARKQGWNILLTLSQPTEILVRNLKTA